ncbi:MAG TPA: tryptophan--tRNA ligase [Mycobacteriales bacterium]|nr:tryptophan--tRNA ligase [Mycobacteriales bacterium]
MPRPRVLSGIQPSGEAFHLGSWLGAVRQWVAMQDTHDAYYCVVDLHAMTLAWDAKTLAQRTRESAAELLAAGLDPERCTLFVQSHVPEHPRLSWLLECLTGYGQAARMTAFKEKSSRGEGDSFSVGLLTYPVLQAADILLYQADVVPVGDDQRQHLELTRDLAQRFNSRFGETFTVPGAFVPPGGAARVMDLQNPTAKMSKSLPPAGTLFLRDDPAVLRKKVRSAVTDAERDIKATPEKPGVANLLAIYSALDGRTIAELETAYEGKGYGDLKGDLAEVVVGFVEPYQERFRGWMDDVERLDRVLADGAQRARAVASATYAQAAERVGLLPGSPTIG